GMWRWRCCGSVVRTEMARGHLASPAPLSGRVGRGEMNAGYGNGFAILPTQFCSRDPSPTRLSPLLPNPAFLFCILHRGERPHPAFISPLCIPSPHPLALACETCSSYRLLRPDEQHHELRRDRAASCGNDDGPGTAGGNAEPSISDPTAGQAERRAPGERLHCERVHAVVQSVPDHVAIVPARKRVF